MRILLHDYAGHAFPTDLSRELARRGHQVCHAYAGNLVTPRGPLALRPSDPSTLAFQEVEMDARYPKWKYSFLKRRNLEIAYGKTAARLIREWKPEIVLSGNTPTDSQKRLLHAARSEGACFINWVQDFYGIAIDKLMRKKLGLLGWPVAKYYRGLDRRVLRQSDHCIGITEDFEPLLRAEGVAPERISTIANWAILPEIPIRPKNNAWALEHGLAGEFVFLYTGTLGMKHNPGLIAQLAESMLPQADVRVVVVSEGPGATWLQQQKRLRHLRNLTLLPYQPFDRLPDILGAGDVLVAILEPDAGIFSVPSKVLSYLCAGRPILLAVPAENLAARIVSQNDAGMVHPPGDEAGLIEKAHRLYAERALTRHMGVNARAYADAHFDIARIADRFEATFAAARRSTRSAAR